MNGNELAPLSPQHCLAPGQGGYMQSKYVLTPFFFIMKLRCLFLHASCSPQPTNPHFSVDIVMFSCTNRFIAERLVRAASVQGLLSYNITRTNLAHAHYVCRSPGHDHQARNYRRSHKNWCRQCHRLCSFNHGGICSDGKLREFCRFF